ncbi:hypothetical protein CYMTET_24304 [Cymbomonas tetramitiformis]|uniref:Uncharacterized protein n=1 Tax=Cymbomonas tetramitiformis TaxID=36881 RepID=A0AAE0L067_9CHLO|nr:hypothetical protein CYMTET_24304 [Cymbomonas tetramitiformis]
MEPEGFWARVEEYRQSERAFRLGQYAKAKKARVSESMWGVKFEMNLSLTTHGSRSWKSRRKHCLKVMVDLQAEQEFEGDLQLEGMDVTSRAAALRQHSAAAEDGASALSTELCSADMAATLKATTGTSPITEVQQPVGAAMEGRQPAGAAVEGRQPVGAAVEEQQPVGATVEERQPVGAAVEERQPVASSTEVLQVLRTSTAPGTEAVRKAAELGPKALRQELRRARAGTGSEHSLLRPEEQPHSESLVPPSTSADDLTAGDRDTTRSERLKGVLAAEDETISRADGSSRDDVAEVDGVEAVRHTASRHGVEMRANLARDSKAAAESAVQQLEECACKESVLAAAEALVAALRLELGSTGPSAKSSLAVPAAQEIAAREEGEGAGQSPAVGAATTGEVTPPQEMVGGAATAGASRHILGIDLGTTRTCVAVFDADREAVGLRERVTMIRSGCQATTIPSVVFVDRNNQVEAVGHEAAVLMRDDPQGGLFDAKRIIGLPYSAFRMHAREMAATWPFKVVEEEDDRCAITIRSEHVTPQEVSAYVLDHAMELASSQLGLAAGGPYSAVIAVPAHFTDAQRQATLDAAKMANLEVIQLITEPTAAALAYGVLQERSPTASPEEAWREEAGAHPGLMAHGYYVVFDMGGGTTDVTLVRADAEHAEIQVKAVNGDGHLGGQDFDQVVLDVMLEWCAERKGSAEALPPNVVPYLLEAAKRAKHALSTQESVAVSVYPVDLQERFTLTLCSSFPSDSEAGG